MRIPSSILVAAQQHAEGATRDEQVRASLLERLLMRPDELWTHERLGAAAGVEAAEVEQELAAVLIDGSSGKLGALLGRNVLRCHSQGWSCGPAGVYERLRVPSAYEVERWVNREDYAILDTALAATKTPWPRAFEGAPLLRWRDGRRLSSGAKAWYLGQLLAGTFVFQASGRDASKPVRGAAGLVEPALDEADTVTLARWVLGAKLPASSRARVPRSVAVLNWIGVQVESGELSRTRALALMGTDRIQSRRWAFRWGELRSPRYPDAISDERIEGLWPRKDDATGTLEQWSGWIGEVLERAMIEQRSWRLADFREAYLQHPRAREVAEGLVFVVGGLPVVFAAGKAQGVEGPLALELAGEVRVAHPAEGIADWPITRAKPPFGQREHPVHDFDELPTPPTVPVPHGAWKRRARALRLVPDEESAGGTRTELWLLGRHRVHIDHAGYGAGYGGARPIEGIEVSVRIGGQPPLARLSATHCSGWDAVPRWLASEVSRMLAMLFGTEPLPAWSRPR